jgi:16S rRNA (guanine966-N2)-methyltransferase
LIFVDPPYDLVMECAPPVFARLAEALPTRLDPLVVFELPGELDLAPGGWTLVKRLGKGQRQPTVCFFRRLIEDGARNPAGRKSTTSSRVSRG